MKMLRFKKAIIALAAAVPLAAALGSPSNPALAETIKIGVITDRVGNAAYYAGQIETGMNLAAKEINAAGGVLGRKIEILYEDDQNKPDLSATKARKLVGEGAITILSISSSTTTQQAQSVTLETKTPHIAPANSADTLTTRLDNPYFFQMGPLGSDQMRTLINYTGKRFKRIALVSDSTGLSTLTAKDFKNEMTKAGIQVVVEQVIEVGSTDVVPQLQRVRAANPDAIVVAAISIAEVTLFFRGYHQLGLKYPVLASYNLSVPAYLDLAPNLLNGTFFVDVFDPDKEQAKRFVAAYAAEYKKAPFGLPAFGYDAIYLMADVVKRAGSTDKEKVRQAIAETKNFVAVIGAKGTTLGFPPGKRTGYPPKGSVIRVIEDNKHGKVVSSGY
jgi:branched-chain amino acid transport system substrate-binding protein